MFVDHLKVEGLNSGSLLVLDLYWEVEKQRRPRLPSLLHILRHTLDIALGYE